MDPANRDAAGRFGPGNLANPSGRPREVAEFKAWLQENALEPAKLALLRCLASEDGKVQMMAVKEVSDRLFGRAPMAITGADGAPLMGGVATDILATLKRLAEDK